MVKLLWCLTLAALVVSVFTPATVPKGIFFIVVGIGWLAYIWRREHETKAD